MQLEELINGASHAAGNDYRLAKAIGVAPQKISNWRSGTAGCGVEYRALMASLAGFNVDEVIHEALLEKHANTPLGERLLSVLGNVGAGAVATIGIFVSAVLFSATPTPAQAAPMKDTTRCIMLLKISGDIA